MYKYTIILNNKTIVVILKLGITLVNKFVTCHV